MSVDNAKRSNPDRAAGPAGAVPAATGTSGGTAKPAPAAARVLPAPLVNPEAKPWFDAAAEGRLLYRRCDACGRPHHPPRSICPHCFSDAVSWRESAGTASVYSSSTLLRGTPTPYCIAWVTLDEGVTLLTNLVDCGVAGAQIGLRVRVRFVAAEGGAKMPVFEPIGESDLR